MCKQPSHPWEGSYAAAGCEGRTSDGKIYGWELGGSFQSQTEGPKSLATESEKETIKALVVRW